LNMDLFVNLTPDFPGEGLKTDRSAWMNMRRMTPEQMKTWRDYYGPRDKALMEADLKGKDLVRWKYQRYAKNYLRSVKGVDESVGTIRAALKDLGLEKNTIVIYSSDQGFYIGDHGWYDKRWMYEESLKMPLIVSWPGVTKPKSKNTEMVQNLDYAETFLDIAGAPIPDDMQGKSLVPLLKGEKLEKPFRDAIYYHYYEYPSVHMIPRHNGVRTDRYKLMQFYEFGEWEMYDLEKDPDELRNVYGDPEYAEVQKMMKEKLAEMVKKYDDDSVGEEKPQEWQDQFWKVK
ncbi:MAG: DUF4976 domain-containing protein, partial [Verrucomicrobiales bacterium]|nr:DUF4976 domain-containing protein [Verrucomicrobiales bacterium]